MSKLPKKAVVFFFSDIENSTRLVQQFKDDYPSILQRHREVVRKVLKRFGGLEVDTAGDGFFVIFDRAEKALAAARTIQQIFALEEWAKEVGLRVRIGVHSGEAYTNGRDFTGLEVHRASRIGNIAHGGQVLASEKAYQEATGGGSAELDFKPVGTFQLKGFENPETLYQLVVPGGRQEFPPPNTWASKPSLILLPIEDLSADKDQEYFCLGLGEEILLALNQVKRLQVLSSRGIDAQMKMSPELMEWARSKQVHYLLEGTLRKNGPDLRLTIKLLEVGSGIQIWSKRYDRKARNVFSVQDEIAGDIAQTLKLNLVEAPTPGFRERQTGKIPAYEWYVRGRRKYYRFSRQGVLEAIGSFEKAIEIDRDYALAYCGLADCYAFLYLYVEESDQYRENTERASEKAIQLAPLSAEAHAAIGMAHFLNGRMVDAEKAFEKAVEFNTKLFEAWFHYGRLCFATGKLDKAARLFEEASRARPDDFQAILLAGQVYADLGIQELARKSRLQGVALAESRLKLNPSDTRALYLGANGLVALGERERGKEWLERALEIDSSDPILLYNAACIYSLLDMAVEALSCLRKSIDQGLSQRGWLDNDSNLDNLRKYPEFRSLLNELS